MDLVSSSTHFVTNCQVSFKKAERNIKDLFLPRQVPLSSSPRWTRVWTSTVTSVTVSLKYQPRCLTLLCSTRSRLGATRPSVAVCTSPITSRFTLMSQTANFALATRQARPVTPPQGPRQAERRRLRQGNASEWNSNYGTKSGKRVRDKCEIGACI